MPAIDAMPPAMMAKSSPRETRARYGPHEERRLDHADEHVRRGRQPDHAADAHRLLQQRTEIARTIAGSTRQ